MAHTTLLQGNRAMGEAAQAWHRVTEAMGAGPVGLAAAETAYRTAYLASVVRQQREAGEATARVRRMVRNAARWGRTA